MKKPDLIVCSAQDAVKYVLSHFSDPKTGRPPVTKEPYAAISIQDEGSWNFGFTLTKNRFCRDVLTLYFDDYEESGAGVKLMDEQQAAQIIHFLMQHQETENILIHCFAGQSRSAAVGKFAAELYGLPVPEYPYFNQWVYDTLQRVYQRIMSA